MDPFRAGFKTGETDHSSAKRGLAWSELSALSGQNGGKVHKPGNGHFLTYPPKNAPVFEHYWSQTGTSWPLSAHHGDVNERSLPDVPPEERPRIREHAIPNMPNMTNVHKSVQNRQMCENRQTRHLGPGLEAIITRGVGIWPRKRVKLSKVLNVWFWHSRHGLAFKPGLEDRYSRYSRYSS